MENILNFFAIDFNTPLAKTIDWLLTTASTLYAAWLFYRGGGFYAWLAVVTAVFTLWMTLYRPLPRIQRWVRGRFVKRRG